jgi:cyclopropane-fatty-acyl-phospholipid synthase
MVVVHSSVFWERIAWGGSIGAAEAYCEGHWSTPDLVAVIRIFARNQKALQGMDSGTAAISAPIRRFLHYLRSNTKSGSIRNISAHYDTGNDFFSKFLDSTLSYSCAIFPDHTSSLETAQQWKLEMICKKLELRPSDHVLEIGTGWGGLAIHAARKHGCRVTTTTISQQQFDYAAKAVTAAGLESLVTVLKTDYRDLPRELLKRQREGFDKLVSIEMIEAVGHRYLPLYFEVVSRMLKPDGLALLQAITIPDQRYDDYRRSVDFIQQYIFPGGLVPSLARIQECIKTSTDLGLVNLEDLTLHYARTLAVWSQRFKSQQDSIAALGLTEEERRKWMYYFGYCEGGFRERIIGDVQILLGKPLNRSNGQPSSWG